MRKITQFSGPVRMISGRYGDMFYNKHDSIIGRSLEYYGEYCEHEMELFAKIIRPGQCVWEIGANIGSQSVGLSKMVGEGGQLIVVEPQIELFKILTTNLCANNCQNTRPLNYAMGDKNGVIKLPKVDYNLPNNFGGIGLASGLAVSETAVELRSLDSLCEYLPAPHFIKIDVEGMEVQVFEGGRRTIERAQPFIYAENDRVEQSQGLLELLFGLGYECFWHITTYYNRENFFKDSHEAWKKNMSSFNMLCVPKSKGIKIEGLTQITDPTKHPLKRD